MELSAEDTLRINVLLAGQIEAIRIDESSMTLNALSAKGEARIKLNPNCRDEIYLRKVRETLSSHVLGSPGGYPVYLKRWARMGQTREGLLESLLLLGEPEAVVAVVNSSGITNEIARRAWWSLQSAENARCMLRHKPVVEGEMGPVLADFLVEFLPFEQEACDLVASVSLVLQSNLVSNETRNKIWARGKSKNAYYVGFLLSSPDHMPVQVPAHPCREEAQGQLALLAGRGNPYARLLSRLLNEAGQGFLKTVSVVLAKPLNQDVVVALLQAITAYFACVRPDQGDYEYVDDIKRRVEGLLSGRSARDAKLGELLETVPALENQVRAMLVMSLVGEPVVNPIFSRTDAIGSVMRKKLQPVTAGIQQQIDILTHKD